MGELFPPPIAYYREKESIRNFRISSNCWKMREMFNCTCALLLTILTLSHGAIIIRGFSIEKEIKVINLTLFLNIF
jgi:hypothetical protein